MIATVVGEGGVQTWDNIARALATAANIVEPGGAIALCSELTTPTGVSLRGWITANPCAAGSNSTRSIAGQLGGVPARQDSGRRFCLSSQRVECKRSGNDGDHADRRHRRDRAAGGPPCKLRFIEVRSIRRRLRGERMTRDLVLAEYER